MTRFSLLSPEEADFQSVVAAQTLSPEAVDWATAYCQRQSDRYQRWQALLHGMALLGVQQWLQTGATDLDVRITADYQLEVNGYSLQVIAIGSLMDEWVERPGASLSHLYVLAEVLEETNQVTVLAALRADHLHRYCATQGVALEACNRIPLGQFVTTPDQLLLYLACLPASQLLSAAVVTLTPQPSPANSLLTNVSIWLQGRLDAAAEQLAWYLLPPLTPAAVRGRSAAEEITRLLQDIDPQRLVIPPEVRGAYQTVMLGGCSLRLYALVWPVLDAAAPPEWSLLLVLTAEAGELLPDGLRLQIRGSQRLLADQVFGAATGEAALYAQVLGNWSEIFTVALSLPDGDRLTLPPFTYQPTAE